MIITSPAFGHNQSIPTKYTCDGENINPPLSFMEIPPGTKSLALIVDDPDAPGGTFVHWLVWNMHPETAEIAEAAADAQAVAGINGFDAIGYGGPCPPPEEKHRYFFRLYALASVLNLPAGSTHEELNRAMGGQIIAEASFFGLYKRLGQDNGMTAINPPDPAVGIDTEEVGLTDEPAATKPVPENKRMGVRTNKGADPKNMDQGNEQYEGSLYGTPDDETPGYGNEGQDKFIDKPAIK